MSHTRCHDVCVCAQEGKHAAWYAKCSVCDAAATSLCRFTYTSVLNASGVCVSVLEEEGAVFS